MTSTTAFSPDALLSQASAVRFLNADREADATVQSANAPLCVHLHGRFWSSSWLDFDELYYLFRNFALTVTSYVLHVACLTDLSKKTWIMSRHAMADATAIRTEKIFQENLLTRSINAHREDSSDFYLQSPHKIAFVTHPNPDQMNFFHQDGVCRGMCHWFISLYFKTQGRFATPEEHVRAVGRRFEHGASRQSAFLHSLTLPPIYDLLQLNVQHDNSKIKVAGKAAEEILREFQRRVPGVYGIYTSSHQVVYIKIDDNQQYLFDPNTGCIKITSTQLFKNAMKPYFESHDSSREILIDRYSPR